MHITKIACPSSKNPAYKDWAVTTTRIAPADVSLFVGGVFSANDTSVKDVTLGPDNASFQIYSLAETAASSEPYNPLASDYIGALYHGTVLIVGLTDLGSVMKKMVNKSKKPKQQTGFDVFVKSLWKKEKESLPKDTNYLKFTKMAADPWNAMSAESKAPYEAEAAKLNQELISVYEEFMASHPQPPAGPRTAQFFFSSAKKAGTESAVNWNDLTEESKASYVSLAQEDVARYEAQYRDYASKCTSLNIPPAGQVVRRRKVTTTNEIKKPRAARVPKPKAEKPPKEPKEPKAAKVKRSKQIVDDARAALSSQPEPQAAVVY